MSSPADTIYGNDSQVLTRTRKFNLRGKILEFENPCPYKSTCLSDGDVTVSEVCRRCTSSYCKRCTSPSYRLLQSSSALHAARRKMHGARKARSNRTCASIRIKPLAFHRIKERFPDLSLARSHNGDRLGARYEGRGKRD